MVSISISVDWFECIRWFPFGLVGYFLFRINVYGFLQDLQKTWEICEYSWFCCKWPSVLIFRNVDVSFIISRFIHWHVFSLTDCICTCNKCYSQPHPLLFTKQLNCKSVQDEDIHTGQFTYCLNDDIRLFDDRKHGGPQHLFFPQNVFWELHPRVVGFWDRMVKS